jgi:hypothetical protein
LVGEGEPEAFAIKVKGLFHIGDPEEGHRELEVWQVHFH